MSIIVKSVLKDKPVYLNHNGILFIWVENKDFADRFENDTRAADALYSWWKKVSGNEWHCELMSKAKIVEMDTYWE